MQRVHPHLIEQVAHARGADADKHITRGNVLTGEFQLVILLSRVHTWLESSRTRAAPTPSNISTKRVTF